MHMVAYERNCRKLEGGIARVAIIRATALGRVAYDLSNDIFTSVEYVSPAEKFVEIGLPEDQAWYTETVAVEGGICTVKHELRIPFEGLAAQENKAVAAILEQAQDGVAAIVRTAAGEVYMLGYSTDLGLESALRPAEVKSGTGTRAEEIPLQTVVLSAVDGQRARLFTDSVSDIFK